MGDRRFSLLLKGGRVVDPASGTDEPLDVAVADGRIVAVDRGIPTHAAEKVLSLAGLLVVPGLVDMHCHVLPQLPFHRDMIAGLYPDAHLLAQGVTAAVDAGTIGWGDFARVHEEIIKRSRVRVLAFVNVAKHGMLSLSGEDDPANFSADAVAKLAAEFSCIVGSKTAHYWVHKPFTDARPAWASVDCALASARKCGLRAMVDMQPTAPGRTYPALLERLQAGDIHTHVFAPQFDILDEAGRVREFVMEARQRGVCFDTGHGAGSFVLRHAGPAVERGFYPDTISTDLYLDNVAGPVYGLLHVMSKFLALGMPLSEVLASVTSRPAAVLGRPEIGHLQVGAPADIAVLRRRQGSFAFADSESRCVTSKVLLEGALTVLGGDIVYNPYALGLPDWREG